MKKHLLNKLPRDYYYLSAIKKAMPRSRISGIRVIELVGSADACYDGSGFMLHDK